MPIDLKKEIKLSDVFKRRDDAAPKDGAPPQNAAAPAPPPEKRTPKAVPAVPQLPLMRAFNLMPTEEAREKKGRRSTASIALAIVAVLLFGALGSLFLVSSGAVAEKKAERDELRTKLAALNVPAKAPEEEQAPELAAEEQARTTELATALQSRVAWDRLLRDFALVLPDDVWLTTLVAKGAPRDASAAAPAPAAGDAAAPAPAAGDAYVFNINGYTHEQEGVARLLARLSVLPELASVSLVSSTRTQVNEQEVVQFTISATVKQGAGGAS